MASESSSSQQPPQLTPSSKVNFKCDDGIIAYNIDNTLGNSSTRRSKNYVSMPKKETVRVGLETLGLVNEDKPSLSSTTLVNSSPFLSLMIEKLMGENYNNNDLTLLKPYTISDASFKKPLASEVALTSHIIKGIISRTQVADTQHDEEPVATADTTQSLDASGSAEELRNQPKPADAKKVQENIVERAYNIVEEEHDEATDSGFKSLGNVTFEELNVNIEESPFNNGSEIKLIHPEEADSDLESMPRDEIESVFGFEAAESDDEKNDKPETKVELSKSEEATTDNVLNELADMATNMNASVHKPSMLDLVVAGKLDESVPRMVANAFKERMHDLLSNTLKNILTQIIEEFVKQAILKFDQRVQQTLKEEQSSKQAPSTTKPVPPVSTALVVHSSEEKPTKDEPPFKRLRVGPLPITKISYRINNSTKQAFMQITRDSDPFNLTIYDNFVLKMLGFSEWLEVHALASKVKTQAVKLGISPPPQLTAFGLSAAKKKRKRTSEIIKEVFVKENIIMDGMHKTPTLPLGVVPSEGLVIKELESGIFFYNASSSNEDSLSTKHQQAVKGLAKCKALVSNLRRIQVKDIVKEVKDYLKTYSSVGMDISWSKSLQVFEFIPAKSPFKDIERLPASSLKSIEARVLLLKEYKTEAINLINSIQLRIITEE
ncbi:hypothetical protein Tco_1508701 [Tanacetum coccineum]